MNRHERCSISSSHLSLDFFVTLRRFRSVIGHLDTLTLVRSPSDEPIPRRGHPYGHIGMDKSNLSLDFFVTLRRFRSVIGHLDTLTVVRSHRTNPFHGGDTHTDILEWINRTYLSTFLLPFADFGRLSAI